MRARILPAALVALVLACAGPASAGHKIFVGAAEDAAKADLVTAKAKMTLARLAGFDAIRMTALWEPGLTAPGATTLAGLRNAADAASLNGIRVILSVYQRDQRTTPLTPGARQEFATFAASLARSLPSVTDYIVGNEPNLNLFWMPQFNPNGSSASPAAYVQLLALTYDALKAVSPKINVIGGSVSPRGQDKASAKRQTHSPTRFIPELGVAYRKSGRKLPIMDTFSFHPYLEPGLPPTFKHPKSTTVSLNDYDKLVPLLAKAFDGTAQPGSKLPIIYDEFGYESDIPAQRVALYNGNEPVKVLDEGTFASYYRQALELAACQPNVRGMLFFLVADEPQRSGWQSGVYYADDTPKTIMPRVRDAALAAREGTLGSCGAAATPAVPTPSLGKPKSDKAKDKPKTKKDTVKKK
jgi:hypothetical protein